jgi:hypothetical protein
VLLPVDSGRVVAAVRSGAGAAVAAGVSVNVVKSARTRAKRARNEDMQASSAAVVAY